MKRRITSFNGLLLLSLTTTTSTTTTTTTITYYYYYYYYYLILPLLLLLPTTTTTTTYYYYYYYLLLLPTTSTTTTTTTTTTYYYYYNILLYYYYLLLLPHAKSKTRDHISCLKRSLELWEKGDLAKLLKEGKSIQNHLRVSSTRYDSLSDDRIARTFSKLMMEGRVRAALRLLVKDGRTGLLKLDQVIGAAEGSTGKTVKEILEEKHPDANQAYGDAILSRSDNELHDDFHPILFESIDAEVIRNSALRTQGAAGPSGADAMLLRRFCTAFGMKSNDLCSALAACARRICTTYMDPSGLMSSDSPGQMSRGTPYWDWRGCSQDNWESDNEDYQVFSPECCWLYPTVCRP